MRHRKRGRHLNRTAEHRRMMLRNMATSLFRHGRVETTVAKAKELRVYADGRIDLETFFLVRKGRDGHRSGDHLLISSGSEGAQ